MAKDYEKKQVDMHAAANEADAEQPALDDPLLELARIVHKNKELGTNVSSGRVGSTDYFAGLDEFSTDALETPEAPTSRVEPSFASAPAQTENLDLPQHREPSVDAPVLGEVSNQFFEQSNDAASSAERNFDAQNVEPAAPSAPENVSPLWPRISEPKINAALEPEFTGNTPAMAPQMTPEVTVHSERPDPGHADSAAPLEANEQSNLAPSVALDLEQNLTAELEDELIGALRQSVDDDEPSVPQETQEPLESDPFKEITEPGTPARSVSGSLTDSFAANDRFHFERQVEDRPQANELRAQKAQGASVAATETGVEPKPVSTPRVDPAPGRPQASKVGGEPARPAIDENDLFVALNAEQTPVAPQKRSARPPEKENPAGIDALFADLDFPDPVDRGTAVAGDKAEKASEVPSKTPEDDIDDMTWPAAAEAVPRVDEEETRPPPEGYDLDAVARAMQESDPSLSGEGVLPPHPAAEEAAVPQARERSRRGLFVTLGVIGIAALGGAAFFLIDGNSVQVPSGPPPIISGLQEPLKIYPEQSQAQVNGNDSKLIYDRVGETGSTGPERLVLPETPQPASLPPAPETLNGGADLAPGAPKQVTTIRVGPDGKFQTEGQPAPSDVAQTESPVASEPVATAAIEPEASAPLVSGDTPRVISTESVTTETVTVEPSVSEPPPAVTTPVETPVEPTVNVAPVELETPEAPALVSGAEQAAPTEPETAEPVAPVPTVLPRKKPAVPVQVAAAPAAQADPVSATQRDGPLNLTNAASTSAPATTNTPTTSGSIPSGTYIVQVTSQRSAAAASDAYAGLQRRYPSVLGNRNAVIVSADLGDRGVFYRARIPMQTRAEAISLCESLQGAGGDCFVRRQP